jgi:hypothetical protein
MSNSKIQNSFETIDGITRATGNAVKQGTADVLKDATQSLIGNYGDEKKTLPPSQKTNIKSDDAKKAAVIRQNIAQMNQQQKQNKQQSMQTKTQAVNNQVQEQQVKKFEANKRESVLMKLLKNKKGTRESDPRTGG